MAYYRPDSESGFSAHEREAYACAAEVRETSREAHFQECCRIAELRRQHGFTLDERDLVSDWLSAAMPLPLPTDDSFTESIVRAHKLLNASPARPRNLKRSSLERGADVETLADDALGQE